MDPMSVEFQDTETVMGDIDEILTELTIPAQKSEALAYIGKLPTIILSNFRTNGIRLDSATQGKVKGFGPRLQELAQAHVKAPSPDTEKALRNAISEFRTMVNDVLTRGSVGTGATGARRRKTRKGKGRKGRKGSTRRR